MKNGFFKTVNLCVVTTTAAGLSGCSNSSCGSLSKITDEPSCHSLRLTSARTPIGGGASCVGASFSRQVVVQCDPMSGTNAQCTSSSNGFPLYVLLLANNTGGSFTDQNGTVYSNCGAVWQAFNQGLLVNVLGYYATTAAPDFLSCTDSAGCSLGGSTTSCISSWGTAGPQGTASLPNGTQVLVCAYIDNSLLALPPAPVAYSASWNATAIPALTISGNLQLTTGWQDAY